jgi:hypothetical protein
MTGVALIALLYSIGARHASGELRIRLRISFPELEKLSEKNHLDGRSPSKWFFSAAQLRQSRS